ncbi:MAG: tRNA uridine-5-carboxymethylaminomethyl(34) synthesis GTPase MnmE [Candidatus Omnitrophica bacterium]|nr:tRNA uridine-5-carboxymethylaminomethyl(34) synthesis GTPase MnmE [Candidatus Omnitrophota bacterium]
MYQLKNMDDTIVAVSTAAGQGGIGIVRLSGKDALSICDRIFQSVKADTKPSQLKSHTVNYGWIVDQKGERIDEVLLTIMRAPKSYTKEDVVEISCHGGTISLHSILTLATEAGARLAEPGEFTKRAFINGRIDLAQAEAVLDIIQSKTKAFLKVSTHQLKGELSTELESIRQDLMNVYIEMEAIVNFPEDDIDSEGRQKLSRDIDKAKEKVDRLLSSSEHGRILKEGIKVVLCGKPNVGKSSLLNIFLKTPRAIVSEIAGTTRDTIEETAQIKGIPFQVIDTAGILTPRDKIEEEAVKRSHMHIQAADLILFVLDSSVPIEEEDIKLMNSIKEQNVLIILNKEDLFAVTTLEGVQKAFGVQTVVSVSALTKNGIELLEETIVQKVWHEKTVDTHGVMVSNLRHITALKGCRDDLQKGRDDLLNNLSLEFISEYVKQAVNGLDSITGRNIDTDLLDNIFSQFCIGK